MERNELRGKILSKFKSIQAFATFVGWSNRKAYDIVNGKQEMTATDIDVTCKALDIEIPMDMVLLFF